MFNDDEITNILAYPDILEEALSSRMSWIKTSDLAQEGINTEKMTLIHLLWLQHAGRLSLRMLIPSRESSSSGSISKD